MPTCTLESVVQSLSGAGVPVRWLEQDNRGPMVARPVSPLSLAVDAAIVIPDVHLGVGPGDAFQESDPSRVVRLERFLDACDSLSAHLGARVALVQLGDFFDVMRSSNPAASFEDRLAIVRRAYPTILDCASRLPLLHCIGNHDHELYDHRAELPSLGISAHIARSLGSGVLAFHGNDLVSLRDIELDDGYQTWLLSLVQTITNMPLVGGAVDALQRYFDASLEDPILGTPDHTSLPWPAAPAGATVSAGWTAPWIVRDDAEQLGEPLLDWERTTGSTLAIGILGHSHRPGIGWVEVDFERRIPLVDVGSWTYGRTNFAIVCPDGVGIAEIA